MSWRVVCSMCWSVVGDLQVVEKIQRLLESWTSEQQLSVEILVDDISLASAAVTSLVKHQGSLTTVICTQCIHFTL